MTIGPNELDGLAKILFAVAAVVTACRRARTRKRLRD